MSALYDLFENPPSPDGEKQPLHARIVSKGTVDKEAVSYTHLRAHET